MNAVASHGRSPGTAPGLDVERAKGSREGPPSAAERVDLAREATPALPSALRGEWAHGCQAPRAERRRLGLRSQPGRANTVAPSTSLPFRRGFLP